MRDINRYRNEMFGKRGETPPLPRNCDARTLFHRKVKTAWELPLIRYREGKF